MLRYNDCEECPYFSSYIPYFSDDGYPVEECGAGFNPEDGCRHSRLVRWILAKIEQRKARKSDKYLMEMLEAEERDLPPQN